MSQENKPTQTPTNNPQPEYRGPGLHPMLVIFLITIIINLIFTDIATNRMTQIEYSQFLQLVDGGHVATAQLSDASIQITLKEGAEQDEVNAILFPDAKGTTATWMQDRVGSTFVTGRIESDLGLTERLESNGVRFVWPIDNSSPLLSLIISWAVPIIIIYLAYTFLFRKLISKIGQGGGMMGGMMGVGKSTAKKYNVESETGVTFADVAGQDEAKESLYEMVDYLHNPGRYRKIGAKQPKGALLVGPPGTGKTLLAKAMAGEAKVPFYSLVGSEFVEMYVGVGASRVRDLFKEANENAPCIVFIDEIDAIGKSRDNQLGSNDEREQTLNQLLSEMDGFDSSKGIVLLAATNRPEILDKALLRPGRFDRRIIVEKPDLPGREAILRVHASRVQLGDAVNLNEIALNTSGATGADLANMVNEAALRAVKLSRDRVLQEDLMEAVEVIIAGKEKKDRILNPKEKRIVAYHEIGHALVSALQKDSMPVQKITIVPRTMGSLGYTMNTPEEERYLMTRDEMLAQISTLMGGRAAELVEFGIMSTGSSNDIERATDLARSMVTRYGMSDRFGPMGLESTTNQYLDGRRVSTCSEQTVSLVDEEVAVILKQCEENAIALLQEHRSELDKISAFLLERENITGEQFMALLKEAAQV